MYLDHFGLSEPPFRITPHTDFFFEGANRGATLEALLYAITHDEGIVKVSGEVGSGKTMLCRVLMERLPQNVETIYLADPSLPRDEILIAIADELRLDVVNDRPSRLLRALLEHLIGLYSQGRRVVVLIDEAHAMPRETLEEVRLLSNLEANRHKLLQIVLFGQPELDEHLNTASMRQLKERITHTFRLEPLVRRDIERYIDFRMRAAGYRGPDVFSAAAIRVMAEASAGLTRRVNILGDKSLLAAFAANTHAVTVKEVRRAIRDSEFYRAKWNWRPFALAASGVAGGLAVGLGAHVMLTNTDSKRPPEPQRSVQVTPAAVPNEPISSSTTVAAALSSVPGAATTPVNAASAPRQAPESDAPAPNPGRSPQPPARGALAKERFAATQEWLKTAPGDNYAIQLITVKSSELSSLEDFLLKASRMVARDDLHVYSVKIDGAQYYRVAYGGYANVSETLAAMRGLPPLLWAQGPYYRSVDRMRSQNRQ